ncbi:MAG: SPOR domain-containing protein [Rudaea sp.]
MAAKRGKQAFRGGERRSWPAWIWLALGTAFGVILSVVVLYGGKLPTLRGKNLPQPNPDATAPKESEQALADDAKKAAPAKSNFDFYSVLPEKEVVIPDAELSAKAKAEQARAQQQAQAAAAAGTTAAVAPATAAGGGHYMLQVVATGDARAADEFKARLAMLGFAAKVYTSTSDGKTINRVRLGPYASASEAEAAKKSLAENSINSFPVADAPGR